MKKLLLSLGLLLGLVASATAQGINVVPQVGLITSILKNPTYSAVSIALVPAASATDIFCIGGSTTKGIHLVRIGITGTAGTLVTAPFTLLLRHSLDTGGTLATTTANPANTDGPNSPSDPAATASLVAYTANPTITDSSPTYLRSAYLTLPTTAAGTVIHPIEWRFGTSNDFFNKGADIIKATTAVQQYCINLNGTSITSGVLQIDAEWTEQ